ncbi:MAG: hypothetical protein QNJ91_04880, partial [Gammaproteobacteria bacterium]|nr:hypothetical protein [Gammaproteobacteria bacterium]
MLIAWASASAAIPEIPDEDQIPPEYRHDLLVTFAQLKLEPLPIAPRGQGTSLAYSLLGEREGAYRAEHYYLLPDGEAVGVLLDPRPGFIDVPRLSGDRTAEVYLAHGAVGVSEVVPRTIRYTDESGAVIRAHPVGRGSEAGTGIAEVLDEKRGTLVGGFGGWLNLRDADDDARGNQGAILQLHAHLVARTRGGPKQSALSAHQTEQRITRLPRDTLIAPVLTAGFVTTMGFDELPKPGRRGSAVLAFEGRAHFQQDPLWYLRIEYTPQGKTLVEFQSSDVLRDADDITKTLDDALILNSVRKELGLEFDNGEGGFDVFDLPLFEARVATRFRYHYTQLMVSVVRLDIAAPSVACLLLVGLPLLGGAASRAVRVLAGVPVRGQAPRRGDSRKGWRQVRRRRDRDASGVEALHAES